MALRAPPSHAAGGNHRRQSEGGAAAASIGFSWDVLARKRIVVGGGSISSRASRSDFPSPGSQSDRKETSYTGGAPAAAAASVTTGGDPFSSGLDGAPDHRVRRPKHQQPDGGWGGPSGGGSLSHPAWRPPGVGVLAPPQKRNDGVPGRMPLGASEVAAASAVAGVSVTSASATAAAAATATAAMLSTPAAVAGAGAVATKSVSGLKFSPNGKVLAAACGSFIYLYRETVNAIGAGGGGGGGGGNASGRGDGGANVSGAEGRRSYRRYWVCTGHSTKVRSFDFTRDGSTLQSNDASGELLFWEVSTGRQVKPHGSPPHFVTLDVR